MAEAQAKASVDGRDGGDAYIHLLFPLLRRGDRFAAVSEAPRDAVIGQLGLAGRLNHATHGRELVDVVPCAAERTPSSDADAPTPPDDLAADDIVLLWSGGFNTWCDVDTLLAALEGAFAAVPKLRLVVTGGAIRGHDETTWERFRSRVDPASSRLVLKGALPTAELRRYQQRADLALVTEKPLYERRLGASARMAEWLALGLPFLSSDTSEIARAARDVGAAMTYPVGDADALVRRIVELAEDPPRRRRMADAGRAYAARELTYAATAAPLGRWVANAERAADAAPPGAPELLVQRQELDQARGELDRVRGEIDKLRRQCEVDSRTLHEVRAHLDERTREADTLREQYHGIRRELGEIHRSRMWKWWMRYLATRGWLKRPFA